MNGLTREYAELAEIPLRTDSGEITEAGLAVAIREEVDFLLDSEPRFHEAIMAALADPYDRWHDEIVLRLTA